MSIRSPGFSERVFEFAFNAEYADRNMAVLAAAPHIPTQNEEKTLGYDVQFELARRGAARLIALQHKVARFVDRRVHSNRHFWDAVQGPYFAFRLDTDQYNLIEDFVSRNPPQSECYYCAPLFASRNEMNRNYLAKSVETQSVWINVSGAGAIHDRQTHTIVYAANGSKAFRFSEVPVELKIVQSETRQMSPAVRQRMTDADVRKIGSDAFEAVVSYWPSRLERARRQSSDTDAFKMPARLPERQPQNYRELGRLLADYYGLSVLFETPLDTLSQ